MKTTGGKGLHVVVPLRPASTWEESFAFSRVISEEMERAAPKAYTTAMPKAQRRGQDPHRLPAQQPRQHVRRRLLDARAAGRTGVGAAHWEELAAGVRPDQFHVGNIRKRLDSLKADPWKRYWSVRQRITAAVRKQLGLK